MAAVLLLMLSAHSVFASPQSCIKLLCLLHKNSVETGFLDEAGKTDPQLERITVSDGQYAAVIVEALSRFEENSSRLVSAIWIASSFEDFAANEKFSDHVCNEVKKFVREHLQVVSVDSVS